MLSTKNVIMASRYIKNLGIKEELKAITAAENKDAAAIGEEIVWLLFDRMTEENNEKLLYDLIGGILNITPEEVETADFLDLVKRIKSEVNFKEWLNFFKSAVQ